MQFTQQKPSRAPTKLPWLGTAFLGLTASSNPATAAVISTSVDSGGMISAGGSLYFDLGEAGGPGAWSTTSFAGADFFLSFESGFGANANKPKIATSDGNRFAAMLPGVSFVERFSAGDTIDTSETWASGSRGIRRIVITAQVGRQDETLHMAKRSQGRHLHTTDIYQASPAKSM